MKVTRGTEVQLGAAQTVMGKLGGEGKRTELGGTETSPTYGLDTHNSQEPGALPNLSGVSFLGFQTGMKIASQEHYKEKYTKRPVDQPKVHHFGFILLSYNSLVLSK